MNSHSKLIACAAAMAICAIPAPSVAASIKPGPVRVVFGESTDEEPRAGDTSQLFYGLSNFITLTSNGPIVWKGRVSKSGRLRFPLAKQSWPGPSMLPDFSFVGLTGTVKPNGKVTLTGKVKGTVLIFGNSCSVTSPIVVSTRIGPGLGLPRGYDFDPATGAFALMSKPLSLTRKGSCSMVPAEPLVFLKGHMKLPGGVPIPKS